MFNNNLLNESDKKLLEFDKWMQKNIDPWLNLLFMLNPSGLLFFMFKKLVSDFAWQVALYSSEQKSEQNLKTQETEMTPTNKRP